MKAKILSFLFVATIFSLMLLSIIFKDKEVSISERRKLSAFPDIAINSVISGEFFENLNNYLTDQFPFRDIFRNIKGVISNSIFQKKDEDGIFIKDKSIYQLNTSINEKSVDNFINLLNKIQKSYIKSQNVYYAVIPDKNYYLDSNIPKMDYEMLQLLLSNKLENMKYINLFDTLTIDSYYKTDIHWRQEKLEKAKEKIEASVNLPTSKLPEQKKEFFKFYGNLYGRIANNLKAENLVYLTNGEIEDAIVFDYEKQQYRKVYETKDLNNIDSYDIYLGGAKPLLIIENKSSKNKKELILFRDSFGSSIAPLLISNYSKITLIDLRYLNSSLLNKIEAISFSNLNQDVLFLYSVPIINNSFTLK